MLKIRNIAVLQFLIFGLSAVVSYRLAQSIKPYYELPKIQVQTQQTQLKELLPRTSKAFKLAYDGRDLIYETLLDGLPMPYKADAKLIAYTVISEANKNGLDPLFVLAVI